MSQQREGIVVRHRTEEDLAPEVPSLLTPHRVSDDRVQVLDNRGRIVSSFDSTEQATAFIEGYMLARLEAVQALKQALVPVFALSER